MSGCFFCFQKSQEFDKIVADLHHLWCDSEHVVDTVGIYVENHEGRNQEFCIWIQFDFWNLNFRGSRLTYWRMPRFLKLGALHREDGEGVRCTLLQGNASHQMKHEKSIRNHKKQKSMFLKVKKDVSGGMLRH